QRVPDRKGDRAMMGEATEDYRLEAVGGAASGCEPAGGWELLLNHIERKLAALRRSAHCFRLVVFSCFSLLADPVASAQLSPKVFTHADTIRGSNTPQRPWRDPPSSD